MGGGADDDGGMELLAVTSPRRRMPAIKPRRRTRRSQPPRKGSRRGSTRRTRSRPPQRQAGRRGATRVGVLTVMRSFPSHRPPRRTTMTIQPRWRMMQHLPPRMKTGRRTTGGASGSSDTTPTGSSTSGMSIKLLWKTPCLPTSSSDYYSRGNSQRPLFILSN